MTTALIDPMARAGSGACAQLDRPRSEPHRKAERSFPEPGIRQELEHPLSIQVFLVKYLTKHPACSSIV
eukprot:13382222-Alexandrium_andersonii.AAC.1